MKYAIYINNNSLIKAGIGIDTDQSQSKVLFLQFETDMGPSWIGWEMVLQLTSLPNRFTISSSSFSPLQTVLVKFCSC